MFVCLNYRKLQCEWTWTVTEQIKLVTNTEVTMEDGHCKTVDEVVNFFNVDSDKGLSLDQVKRNQEKYGLNGK